MDRIMTFRIPAKLAIALQKESDKRHCSMSAIVRQSLLHELARGAAVQEITPQYLEALADNVAKVAARLKRAG
jgi:predicted transcriptional regulator